MSNVENSMFENDRDVANVSDINATLPAAQSVMSSDGQHNAVRSYDRDDITSVPGTPTHRYESASQDASELKVNSRGKARRSVNRNSSNPIPPSTPGPFGSLSDDDMDDVEDEVSGRRLERDSMGSIIRGELPEDRFGNELPFQPA